jgi:putative ABC transport system permease protein
MWIRSLLRRIRRLRRSDAIHKEIADEMQFHLEMRIEENIRRGMSAAEARQEAQRRFGDAARIKERGYDVRGGRWLETVWQDLSYGARMLVKNPGFTLIAVITIGLGVGANTAIFSVVNTVLLRPLPFEEADRLLAVWGFHPQIGREDASLPDFADWRDQNRSFERMAASTGRSFNLMNGEEPERLLGEAVTIDYFSVLRIQPVLGRVFLPEEDRPGASRVVVLSHGLWNRRFNANPSLMGQSIKLNGQDYTVVGIMPSTLWLPGKAELWVPLAMDPTQAGRRNDFLTVTARLKPGVSLEQARTDMDAITKRLEQQYPQSNAGWRADLVPMHEQIVGKSRAMLLTLLAAVGFVLLIACANVANLLLSRAAAREREIAIRAALGAGRGRLIRQLLTESILLALLGGLVGGLLSLWGVNALVGLGPAEEIPRLSEIGVDGPVFGFTILLSLATGVLFGLAPSLQVARLDLNTSLKEGSRSSSTAGGKLRQCLAVSEVALSLILLVGAALMIKNMHQLLNLDAGFNRENLLTVRLALPRARYREDHQIAAFYQQLVERVRGLPGVVSATTVSPLPLSGGGNFLSFSIAGRPAPPPEEVVDASVLFVGDRYIETMGVPLMVGRPLIEQDRQPGPKSTLINQTMARRYFSNQNPLGQRITLDGPQNPNAQWMTIVGVIADVKHRIMEKEVYPSLYIPEATSSMTLVTRARENPLGLTSAIRSEVKKLDPELPAYNIKTMNQTLGAALERERFTMFLLSIFAAAALALAAVGLYGVMSFAVSQRRREIGVRMALGAQRRDVLMMVIGQAGKLALAGVLIGLGGVLALKGVLKTLVFDVSITDPLIFCVTALFITLVALLASWAPARRATKVDPIIALRSE